MALGIVASASRGVQALTTSARARDLKSPAGKSCAQVATSDGDFRAHWRANDHSCFDPPKPFRVGTSTLRGLQDDLVITQHFAVSARLLTFLSDSVNHVALGTRDPRDVFASQFVEMIKVSKTTISPALMP